MVRINQLLAKLPTSAFLPLYNIWVWPHHKFTIQPYYPKPCCRCAQLGAAVYTLLILRWRLQRLFAIPNSRRPNCRIPFASVEVWTLISLSHSPLRLSLRGDPFKALADVFKDNPSLVAAETEYPPPQERQQPTHLAWYLCTHRRSWSIRPLRRAQCERLNIRHA